MPIPGLPRWLVGMAAGQFIWAVAALLALRGRWWPRWLDLFLFDILHTILAVVAAPVTLGGWFFVWGDNGPPYEWIEGWSFIISFGLAFYGVVGAIIGHLFFSRAKSSLPIRFSLRSMLIATTLVAVVLGLAVWAGR